MIHREIRGAVTILRMNYGKVNAIDSGLLDAFSAELDFAEQSDGRAFVLTGTGKTFSAGVDLFRLLEGGNDYVDRFLPLFGSVLEKFFLFPKPVIAAVNGHAIAGGCSLECCASAFSGNCLHRPHLQCGGWIHRKEESGLIRPGYRMRENKIRIETSSGNAPALVFEPDQSRGTVLVYHGLGAAKEVQRKEMGWLADAGFAAICVDAPHHGERADGYLETLSSVETTAQHFLVMKLVSEAMKEIPAIVEYCIQHLSGNVGIVGISLGGFITYGAAVVEPRIKAAVPILGSPDWSPKHGPASPEMQTLMEHAAVRFPERFPPCAVFAANAGKDIFVPPQASREFVSVLKNHYSAYPERLNYIEYSHSEHRMREEDWNDLWQRIVAWFHRFLPPS